MPLSTPWKLALGAGAVVLLSKKGAAVVNSVDAAVLGRAFDWGRQQAFAAVLPSAVGQYAQQILSAARRYDVNPLVLAGIMARESNGGTALKPPGPGGTGSFYPNYTSSLADPATGLPKDGQGGWDRGLMQISYAAHLAWFQSGAKWWEPQVNIDKGAEVLRNALDFFRNGPGVGVRVECWRITKGRPTIGIQPWATKYPNVTFPPCLADGKTKALADPRPLSGAPLYAAAVAAYNAGPGGVLQALAAGLPAEAATAGQDYATWVTAKVAGWYSKYLG